MKLSRGIQTCSTDRAYPSADPPSFCTITHIQIHKYTNTQIHKYTSTQVHKHKHPNLFSPSADWTFPSAVSLTHQSVFSSVWIIQIHFRSAISYPTQIFTNLLSVGFQFPLRQSQIWSAWFKSHFLRGPFCPSADLSVQPEIYLDMRKVPIGPTITRLGMVLVSSMTGRC